MSDGSRADSRWRQTCRGSSQCDPPTQSHSRLKSVGDKQVVAVACCPAGPVGGNQMGAHLESAEAARGLTLSHHLSVSTTFLSGKMSPRFKYPVLVGRSVGLYSFSSLEMTHCLLSSLDWCEREKTAQYELCLSDCCHFLCIDHHRRIFVIPPQPRRDSFSLTENEQSNIFSFGTTRPCYLKDSPSVLAVASEGEVWLFPTQAGWTA